METRVELYFTVAETMYIKKAIEESNKELIDYIDERIEETKHQIEFIETREDREIENLKEANKTLLEVIEIYKQKELEIRDVEMDDFQADIKEMLEKHQPKRKVGRPKGSKNAK